jgi:hypothetical protein
MISVPEGATNIRIMVAVDNDIRGVFFNGKSLVEDALGTNSVTHDECPILDEFRFDVPQGFVQPGENLIAFHVVDRGAESFFDTRILAETPTRSEFTLRMKESQLIINLAREISDGTLVTLNSVTMQDASSGDFTVTATTTLADTLLVEAKATQGPSIAGASFTLRFGAAVQGIQQGVFTSDGKVIEGEIDGRAIVPTSIGPRPNDLGPIAFTDGQPPPVVQGASKAVEALTAITIQLELHAQPQIVASGGQCADSCNRRACSACEEEKLPTKPGRSVPCEWPTGCDACDKCFTEHANECYERECSVGRRFFDIGFAIFGGLASATRSILNSFVGTGAMP